MNRCSSRWLFKTGLVIAVFLCITASSPSAELSVLFEQPARKAVGGEETTIWLNVLNVSDREQRWTFPPAIACQLVTATRTNNVSLDLSDSTTARDVVIAPRNFERRSYRFQVPLVAPGLTLLEPVGLEAHQL